MAIMHTHPERDCRLAVAEPEFRPDTHITHTHSTPATRERNVPNARQQQWQCMASAGRASRRHTSQKQRIKRQGASNPNRVQGRSPTPCGQGTQKTPPHRAAAAQRAQGRAVTGSVPPPAAAASRAQARPTERYIADAHGGRHAPLRGQACERSKDGVSGQCVHTRARGLQRARFKSAGAGVPRCEEDVVAERGVGWRAPPYVLPRRIVEGGGGDGGDEGRGGGSGGGDYAGEGGGDGGGVAMAEVMRVTAVTEVATPTMKTAEDGRWRGRKTGRWRRRCRRRARRRRRWRRGRWRRGRWQRGRLRGRTRRHEHELCGGREIGLRRFRRFPYFRKNLSFYLMDVRSGRARTVRKI